MDPAPVSFHDDPVVVRQTYETDVNTQIYRHSDNALNAVMGGYVNNGSNLPDAQIRRYRKHPEPQHFADRDTR